MSIAAILGIAKGAASYWREILIGLLALGLLWYRGEAANCKADRAGAVIEAQRKADKLSGELVTAQEIHRRELEAVAGSIKERIIRVPVTTACRDVPAMRNAIDGQLQLLGPRGPAP